MPCARSSRVLPRLFAVLALAVLGACGGGGSSSGEAAVPAPPEGNSAAPDAGPATGRVGILITDAPADEFAQINVTVTRIELLGEAEPVELYSGSATIDLLALENFADLFVLADGVPAGQYSKIRLQVAAVELLRLDAAGVSEVLNPKLPGNGKLDLNPRGDFTVTGGETLLVQIDWDANKSLKVSETGNGEVIFRPVVFVDVLHEMDGTEIKLARVQGTVAAVDEANGSFVLCPEDPPSADDDDDSDKDKDKDDDSDKDTDEGDDQNDDADECITVNVPGDAGIFDSSGAPAAFADIVEGGPATVVGTFGDDVEAGAGFDAAVVELGEPGTFARLTGTARSAPSDALGTFDFELDPGQGFLAGSVVSVQLQEGTRVLDPAGMPLDFTAVTEGTATEIDGVLSLSGIEPDVLRAALVVVSAPAGSDTTLSGSILTLDEATSSLVLATDEGDRCVVVPAEAGLFLVTDTDVDASSEAIAFADLAAGLDVDAYGAFDVTGCFVVETLIAFALE